MEETEAQTVRLTDVASLIDRRDYIAAVEQAWKLVQSFDEVPEDKRNRLVNAEALMWCIIARRLNGESQDDVMSQYNVYYVVEPTNMQRRWFACAVVFYGGRWTYWLVRRYLAKSSSRT